MIYQKVLKTLTREEARMAQCAHMLKYCFEKKM